jgi:N-formylglutamate deformylase
MPRNGILQGMKIPVLGDVLLIHGPVRAQSTLVLDSPDCSEVALRDGEDCFIDELYLPAAASGVPLLAAQFPRTYLDPNRNAGDIDFAMLSEPWPDAEVSSLMPSGKARIGKALLWRTLDDGRSLYSRKLSVAEVRHRIEHYHRPYHRALQRLLDTAHQRFGVVHHINCHSMNAISGPMSEGGAGVPRADFCLGDRDGTTCASAITDFVRTHLAALGYSVQVNDPFKGVELVRAYADPAAGRHSLQIEINKRLYMDSQTLQKHAGFATLQAHLMHLLQAWQQRFPALR